MSDTAEAGTPERLTVRFEGRVQGVGFRYTVCRLAAGSPLTGFVRNEPDGSVLLVAEGPPAELRRLLRAVEASELARCIRRATPSWSSASGAFRVFGVAY